MSGLRKRWEEWRGVIRRLRRYRKGLCAAPACPGGYVQFRAVKLGHTEWSGWYCDRHAAYLDRFMESDRATRAVFAELRASTSPLPEEG